MIDKFMYEGKELSFCPGINVFLGDDDGPDRLKLMMALRNETGSEFIVYSTSQSIDEFLLDLEKALNDPVLSGKHDVVLWYKPEEDLHPNKIERIVDFLVKTEKSGKQIFITTNDCLLIGHLDFLNNCRDTFPAEFQVDIKFIPDDDTSVEDVYERLYAVQEAVYSKLMNTKNLY